MNILKNFMFLWYPILDSNRITDKRNQIPKNDGNHTIFRLDTHLNLTYLCAVTFNNNDYGKRKSKLPGGI